jgi:hypothetical protein
MTLYEGTHEDKNIARMLIEEYILFAITVEGGPRK